MVIAEKVVEVEDKYEVPDGFELPDVGGLTGVAGVNDADTAELEAVYYDTDDLRLARSRITMRRRTGGGDAGWHVKLPAGVGRAWNPAPSGTRQQRSGGVPPSGARAGTRGATLIPVARLRTSRTTRGLSAAEAAKRARYAAEAVADAFGADATTFAAQAERVQEALGEQQDIVVAAGQLRAMGIAAHARGESSFTYGLLTGVEEARGQVAHDAFDDVWAEVSRKRFPRWLKG